MGWVARSFRLHRVLAAAIVVMLATPASATPAEKKDKPAATKPDAPIDVETAEQLYLKLDYEKANETAGQIINQRNLSHDQLVRSYKILAVTNAILDKDEAARDAFLQLLILDPDYTLDTNLGPKVSAPFVEARGQYRSLPSKPGTEITANVRADGGQLRVTTRDPTHASKKVNVGHRWTPNGDFTITELAAGESSVEVGPAPTGRTRLDYYAQAVDERDNTIFEAGSPAAPKSTFVEAAPKAPPPSAAAEQKSSIFASPIFWLVAGAAAIGGGTALFFAFRPHDAPTEASLAPVIRCGAEICK